MKQVEWTEPALADMAGLDKGIALIYSEKGNEVLFIKYLK